MIRVSDLLVELGGRPVLRNLSFTVSANSVLGVLGPNGSGKSTLGRVIAADLPPDRGSASLDGAALGYLPQIPGSPADAPVSEEFPSLFADATLQPRLIELGDELAAALPHERRAAVSREYDTVLERIGRLAPPGVIEEARIALDVRSVGPEEPLATLSGGELAKLALLDLVASAPEVLVLDEPTNHLDFAGIAWLDEWLDAFEGPVLLISHDRALLDDHADQILVLSAHDASYELFTGNYSAWAAEDARRRQAQWDQYRRQRREERRMREAISAAESRARGIEQRTIHFHWRKRAAKVARRAVTLKARLEREQARGQRVERPERLLAGINSRFAAGDRSANRLVSVRNVSMQFTDTPLLDGADLEIARGDHTVIVGSNGSGKSTLLRAILGEVPLTAGEIAVAASAMIGWLPQDDRELLPEDPGMRAIDYLRGIAKLNQDDAFEQLHRFRLSHDAALTPVERLSPGELRRLALARLMLSGANLLLLDEPTNHLDLPAREAFEEALAGFEGASVVVTHDRYFIERFASNVFAIEDRQLTRVAGTEGIP